VYQNEFALKLIKLFIELVLYLTKHHNFPVPVFENGTGRFNFFFPNFGTESLFTKIRMFSLSSSISLTLCLYLCLSVFLPIFCFHIHLSVFRFFSFILSFFLFSNFYFNWNVCHFSSSRILRRERELFLVPKNCWQEGLGNCFHKNFGNCRDMTGNL
jgi:hypothetical protein